MKASRQPVRRGRTIEIRRVRLGDMMIDEKRGGTVVALSDAAPVQWSKTIYGVEGARSDTSDGVSRAELGIVKVRLSSVPLPGNQTPWPDPALWEVVSVRELAHGDWILLRDPNAYGGVLAVERVEPGPSQDMVTLHLRDTANAPASVVLHYAASVGRWPASERLSFAMRSR